MAKGPSEVKSGRPKELVSFKSIGDLPSYEPYAEAVADHFRWCG
jgi:hypothetical protein